MNLDLPLALLNGLSPADFMREYWQRKPLLIRQAIPDFHPSLTLEDIGTLVQREEVESRLIQHTAKQWQMQTGPFERLPSMKQPGWTALAQSVDVHDDDTAGLLQQFRFISHARLDDVMISIASAGGGVGPHFDSYDVFLLQAHGQRRWQISTQQDLSLEEDLPLKILKHFQPEQEYILEPGDMLYLPPHVAHDGVALNDCMTISIGFRAPTLATLACGMLEAAGDQLMARIGEGDGLYGTCPLPGPKLDQRYTDQGAKATAQPAQLPDALLQATLKAVQQVQFDEKLAARFLGQWLTEPSPAAWFEPSMQSADLSQQWPSSGYLALDRCSRLMYKDDALYINGELASSSPNAVLCSLADDRRLYCTRQAAQALSCADKKMLDKWLEEGWLHHIPG